MTQSDATSTAGLEGTAGTLEQSRELLAERLLDIYRQQGSLEGYLRAVNEVLMSLVVAAETYLERDPDHAAQLRPLIYGFIEHLDRHIRGLSDESIFVEGGLGI